MPNQLYTKATDFYMNHKDQAALDVLNELLASDPEFIPAYFMRAICNAKLGREAESTADITALLNKDFEKSDLLNHKVVLEGHLGNRKQEEIKEVFITQFHDLGIAKSIALETGKARKVKEHYLHGMICMAASLIENMLEDINALVELLPENTEVKRMQSSLAEAVEMIKMEKMFEQVRNEEEMRKLPKFAHQKFADLEKKLSTVEGKVEQQQKRISDLEAEVSRLRNASPKPGLFARTQEADPAADAVRQASPGKK